MSDKSDTPRTDEQGARLYDHWRDALIGIYELARTLERELAQAREETYNANLHEADLMEELAQARKERDRLLAAVNWALGVGDSDFRPPRDGEGRYYWRTELRERAFAPAAEGEAFGESPK